MKAIFSKLFKSPNDKKLEEYQPLVEQINALEEDTKGLSDDDLAGKTAEFKDRLKEGESLDDLLPEAFAVVREVSSRMLGERHYDVQLLGGIVMHKGEIAEMKTGEGKTLAATLPVYLNALAGAGVHVVTVNDYLSRRDAAWMGQIYHFLGLRVGVINDREQYLYDSSFTNDEQEVGNDKQTDADKERDKEGFYKVAYDFLRPCERREAYEADITYGTNSQFGFDYLRDNIAYKEEDLRQREPSFAIVDEIDSILIDEARTPLIISAPDEESGELYQKFARIAATLKKDEDYELNEKDRAVLLSDSGIEKAEKALGIDNIYTEAGIKYVHHLETAVRAKALFSKDKEYVVRDGEVVIVDQFTGRMMPGRRFSEGLHQALEAKEGVDIQRESRTFASITYQNYFRMYEKLAGMTGTAKTSEEEFYKVYGLAVVTVPTHRPLARIDRGDLIFQSEKGKFKAIASKVKELQENGQPVLIGTVSVEKNELLSEFLKASGVKHIVLNAKNHEREGEIVAEAGRKGAVTVATNMAGRGVDIKLGGQEATKEEYEEVKERGGLFVLGTERHEARRIDDQLRGRAGRQGDPGESQFFVSLEDDLMRVFASDTVKKMMGRLGIPEDQPIENKMITRSLETAQEKIEGLHFDSRKHVLSFDDVLNHQRQTIYARRRPILTGDADYILKELERMSAGNETLQETIEEKKETLGEEKFVEVARRMMLQTIDLLWVDHLQMMDYLRSSVNLRAYGQRDPLVEYKKEGLALFHELEDSIDDQVLKLVRGIGEGAFKIEQQKLKRVEKRAEQAGESAGGSQNNVKAHTNPNKVGRNDPCPCGSGKKYKKCHGK